ncbi:hypothetical protein ACJJTC_012875 [Scirpophaga incertulas]
MDDSSKVDIGFLEEKPSWQLHPKFFPSKVGGKPAWLDKNDIPSNLEACCRKCTDPLTFLCQIYAPFEDRDDAFHRTVFVFICGNKACNKPNCSDNFMVFRCQLPRKNDVYSYEPYNDTVDEAFDMNKWPELCNVCGLNAPSHCAKCKKMFYCCRKHQVNDWHNEHKEICQQILESSENKLNNFIVTQSGKSILFKEWEIIIDQEDEEETSEVDVEKEMDVLHKMMEEKNAGTLGEISEDELDQFVDHHCEDKVYEKFNKRISKHPDQVIRYERGGSPLWITKNVDFDISNIPKCPYCGGERQFEFQIMPQLLNFINVGVEVNSIDWGILAIFTCKQSCNEGLSYKQEYILKQDIRN